MDAILFHAETSQRRALILALGTYGMEGLSPTTGALTFNPTRARGLGADDMLVTSAGLWIASDNLSNSNQCGGYMIWAWMS